MLTLCQRKLIVHNCYIAKIEAQFMVYAFFNRQTVKMPIMRGVVGYLAAREDGINMYAFSFPSLLYQAKNASEK